MKNKYAQVIFTDRPIGKPTGKKYTYLNKDKDLKVDNMVVIQAGSGYSIGQVTGFTESISFDEKLLKQVITKFEVL